MSSRNAFLSASQREQALALSRALEAVRARFEASDATPSELVRIATETLSAMPDLSVEYVEVVDAETLAPVQALSRAVLVAVAARIGSTRLIDNTLLRPAS